MNKQQQVAHGNEGDYCSFHPSWELVVGVCAHCLKDRLLHLLASSSASTRERDAPPPPPPRRRTNSISLPKVFALGSSFLLQRLDSRHHNQQHAGHEEEAEAFYSDDDTASVASLDDSFISIKFEDNGKATWDKQQQQHKLAARSSSSTAAVVAVVDHVKRSGVTRWRKQVVGRLLQLARWKRSAGGGAVVVGMDGKKAARGRGWIRSLTRRRAHGDRAWS